MSQLSEEKQQLYEERLQTQADTNATISNLIIEARSDPKKYLPYGPILMNIYNQQRIEANTSALIRTAEEAKKLFCDKQCRNNDSCLSKCQTFYGWAVGYGLTHFQAVHKYAYTPTVNQDEQ